MRIEIVIGGEEERRSGGDTDGSCAMLIMGVDYSGGDGLRVARHDLSLSLSGGVWLLVEDAPQSGRSVRFQSR